MTSGVMIGGAYVELGGDVAPLHGALRDADRAVNNWAQNTQSSMRRIAEVAAGTLIANVIPRITSGFMGLAKQGLESVANYERLGMSLESLVAKELRQQSVVTETKVLGQQRIELTEKEREKLADLGLQRDLYTAKLQEESERHRQLVAKWGEEGLAVKTHAANMAILQNKYNETGAAIAQLEGKQGKLVTVTQTNSKMTLSMADAMKQAEPKAKELLRWIELLAIKSPFKQEDVAQAFRTAQAYGFVSDSTDKNVVSSKRLTTAMIDFTSATGASGETMNRVAMALGQIKARGKLAGQEVMQLTEAGIAVDQILAQAFGKSTTEIIKMREKGLIPADKAILAITESLERDFGGAAARQATTFAGLISSLGDIKEIGLRSFFDSAFTAAKPLLVTFTDLFSSDAFMSKLDAMGEAFGSWISKVITKGQELYSAFRSGGVGGLLGALGLSPDIQAMVSNFITSLQNFVGILRDGIGQTFVWLQSNVLPLFSQAFAFVVQNWDAFKGALMGIATLLGGAVILGTLMSLAGTIASLANPLTLVIGLAAALGAAWSTNFMGIRDLVMPVINAIRDGIGSFMSSLQSGQSIFAAVGSGLNTLLAPLIGVQDAMSVSTGIMNGLRSAWETIVGVVDRVRGALEMAKASFDFSQILGASNTEALVQAVETFLGALFGFEKVNAIFDSAREAWAMLVDFFTPTIERLKESWGQMVESFAPLGDKLRSLWDAAQPVLETLATVVGVVVVAAFNLLMEVVAAIMPHVGAIIGNAIDVATAFFTFLGTVITNVVALVKNLLEGDFAGAWENVKTIIGGFLGFIETALGALWDNFSRVFSALVTAIVNWVGNIDSEAGKRLQTFVDNVATKVKEIPIKVKTKFDETLNFLRNIDMKTIGINLITSLADAMYAHTIGYLRDRLKVIAENLPQFVKDFLHIKSPSRVFADIGRQIMEGLALGLTEGEQLAWEALAKTFENLIQISEGLSMISGYRANANLSANLSGMIEQMKDVVTQLADMAGWLATPRPGQRDPDWVSAKAGTDPMKDIANNIMAMADGLAALGEFKPVGDVAPKVTDLVNGYKEVVRQFAEFAGWLVTPANFPGGLNLADAVGALGVIATVADAFGAIFDAWKGVASAGAVKIPGDMTAMLDSIVSMMTLVIEKIGGMQAEISDELIDKAGRLADVAGAFGDIAKAWSTVGGAENLDADASAIVDFLKGFAGQVLAALDEVSKTAPTMGDNWQTFTGNVKAAIGLIADVAKAWETVSDFQPNDKLDLDGEDGKGGVVRWLAGLAGLATRAIMEVQQWGGLTPNDQFNAFVTSVKGAIGLISDTGRAWETIQGFKWSGLKVDGDEGVINWLASLAGIATRAIEKVQVWGGITPNEQFNAFVTSVKAAIGLISDTTKAWETIQGFKPNNNRLDMNAVIDWLASVAGLALRALERVQDWGGIAPDEAFDEFTKAIKDSLGALTETIRFTEALDLWESAGNVQAKMRTLTADLRIIVDEIGIAHVNMRALVTDSLIKFVNDVAALAGGLAAVVDLLRSIDELENTGDIPLAVDRIGAVIRSVLTGLQDIIYDIDEDGAALIQNFSSAMGGLMGALKTALELAMAIPDKWERPSQALWGNFTGWVLDVFDFFYVWVNGLHVASSTGLPIEYGEAEMNLVGKFAAALSALMSGLKTALELAIAVPATWARPSQAIWGNFTGWVLDVFDFFYVWVNGLHVASSTGIPIQFGEKELDLVGKFATALSTLMGALKTALDLALAVPATWAPPDPKKWSAFETWVKGVFESFATWIQQTYGGEGGKGQLELVALFGTALESLTNGIATALQLAIAVPATWSKPDPTMWSNFETWVKDVFSSFAGYVQTEFGGEGGAEELNLINTFSQAMQGVMGALKTALDLALALPEDWAGVPTGEGSPYAKLKAFVEKVWTDFATYVKTNMPADSEAAKNMPVVKAFAEAVGAVFSALATALDVFKQLQGYIPLLNTRIENFIGSVTYAYGLVQTYATGDGVKAGTAATKAFAEATSAVFSALKGALDLFKSLVEPQNGLKEDVEVFKTRLQTLTTRIGIVLDAWKTYVETENNKTWAPTADVFKQKINGVFSTLKTALDLFKDLNTAGMPSPALISAFIASVIQLFGDFTTGIGLVPGQVAGAASGAQTTLAAWATIISQDAQNWYTVGYAFGGMLAAGWGESMKVQASAGSFMLNSTYAVTDAIKAAIKKAFGIASASQVMFGYGEMVSAGLGGGILAGLGDVQAAADSLYRAAAPAMALGGAYDVNSRREIVVRFEGQAGGGVPLSEQQFFSLKRELAYAISIGA